MKKSMIPWLFMAFTLIGSALPSVGLLFLIDTWFEFVWPHSLILLGVLLFQTVLYWMNKSGKTVWFWGVCLLLNGAAALVVYKTNADMDRFLTMASLEAACVAAAIYSHYTKDRIWMKMPLMILLFAGLIFFCINRIELGKWEICEILLCFFLFLSELAERKRTGVVLGKAGEEQIRKNLSDENKNVTYLFPIFMGLSLLLFTIPVSSKPISWDFMIEMVKEVRQTAMEAVNGIRDILSRADRTYSISFTGYDQEGTLGGSISVNDEIQMTLEGLETNAPLYLAGSIYAVYTGQGWEMRENPYGEKEYADTYQNLMKILSSSEYEGWEVQEFTRRRNYRISYEELRTESLFTAPATIGLIMPDNLSYETNESGNLVMRKPKGAGFSYNINFLEIDYTNEKMKELLRSGSFFNLLSENEKSQQQEKLEFIFGEYTRLPKELPERVRELAEKITKEAKTDYDRLKAIEAYLNSYTYTTTPKTVPEGNDFTDYFLFESKSGYCSYFATAMAVLARCEGIPVRYVEGFVTNDTCNGDGVKELTGKNAHAWVEAYIDPIGWIPFEPTTGYNSSTNLGWEQTPVQQAQLPNFSAAEVNDTIQDDTKHYNDEEFEVLQRQKNMKSMIIIGCRSFIVMCAVAVLLICFKAVQIYLYWHAYLKKDEYEKILCMMKKILHLASKMGLRMGQGETLEAFCKRAGTLMDTEKETLEEVCINFKCIRFGGKQVERAAADRFERYEKNLERQYLKSCSMTKKLFFYFDKK